MSVTLALIKPDAVQAGHEPAIMERIYRDGFKVLRMERTTLTADQAAEFYAEHSGRPFFDDLVRFMSSGPLVWAVLERDNAVERWRQTIGTTDPRTAAQGSLRQVFGTAVNRNAVHGSADDSAAIREIALVYRSRKSYAGTP